MRGISSIKAVLASAAVMSTSIEDSPSPSVFSAVGLSFVVAGAKPSAAKGVDAKNGTRDCSEGAKASATSCILNAARRSAIAECLHCEIIFRHSIAIENIQLVSEDDCAALSTFLWL
mmetsp:Transcript_15868/g.28556  ORF Transcript_15868/g.28556 Transcript_15868/m.28556 type:complete len:117 (-) Transcript_15868:7-357(-)